MVCNFYFLTGDALMVHLGQMIPKLKSRSQRPVAEQQAAQASSSRKKGKGRR
jgi:hypothetical protein